MILRHSAILAGLTLVATAAFGQEVGTTKKASSPLDLISGQSGNVQLRHYTEGQAAKNQDEIDYHQVTTQVRGNFTVNSFKDRVASTLTLGASHVNDSTNQVTQRRPRLLTEVTAVDTEYFSILPYLDIHGAQPNKGSRGDLGVIPEVKYNMMTAAGEIQTFFHIEAEAQFSSQKEDANFKSTDDAGRAKEFGLAEQEDETLVKKESKGVTYEVIYVPSVTWKADPIVKGLDMQVFVEYDNVYEPVIEVDEDGSEQTVYEPTRDNYTYFRVGYQVTDSLKFDNFLWRSDTGVYESRGDSLSNRYTNLARLSYTMY